MVVGDAVQRRGASKDWQARLMIGVVAIAALALGAMVGSGQNLYQYLAMAGLIVTVYLLLARQDDLVGVVVVVAAIFIDTYQLVTLPAYAQAVGTILAGLAVAIFYLWSSREHPWIRTPGLWIWAIVLVLGALEIPLSEVKGDAVRYFITVLVSMPLAYMLGIQIGRGTAGLRRLLIWLSVVAALISIHAMLQAQFGLSLFLTPRASAALASRANYVISGTDKIRAGSFFINPDKLGAYLGLMLPILIGLAVVLKAPWARAAALAGTALAAVAMLHSYSTASWIATAVGIVVIFFLVARGKLRLYLPIITAVLGIALVTLFPATVRVLTAHATAPGSMSQRIGAWQTGLGAMASDPLIGIGLGYTNYFHRSYPFLSPLQTAVVEDPQNSFIELAAMAGIVVALLYILALVLAFVAAGRNYLRARGDDRVLIGAVIASAVVLTVNSLGTPGWTFPALGIMGWLLLGIVASPALLSKNSGGAERAGPSPAAEPARAVVASGEEGV